MPPAHYLNIGGMTAAVRQYCLKRQLERLLEQDLLHIDQVGKGKASH